MVAIITLQNPIHHATGALSTFIYTLTGAAEYTIERPKGYRVIGISASFATTTPSHLGADNLIVTDVANITVKVYAGDTVETDDFNLTAVVFAMKSGV